MKLFWPASLMSLTLFVFSRSTSTDLILLSDWWSIRSFSAGISAGFLFISSNKFSNLWRRCMHGWISLTLWTASSLMDELLPCRSSNALVGKTFVRFLQYSKGRLRINAKSLSMKGISFLSKQLKQLLRIFSWILSHQFIAQVPKKNMNNGHEPHDIWIYNYHSSMSFSWEELRVQLTRLHRYTWRSTSLQSKYTNDENEYQEMDRV